MAEIRIAAESRSEFGKGAARRIRRAHKVPAVVYGHGTDTRHITLPGHTLMMALKTPNVLLRLEGMDGGDALALPKAVQRHPLKGHLEHVDLLLVKRGEKVTVDIPVQLTGEVASGGLLDQQMVQVSVEAEATRIPQGVEVNIEGMEVGSAVHAGDLNLPRGVTLAADPEALVLHVIPAPTAEQIEAELAEAEAGAGIEREEKAEEEAPPAEEQAAAPAEQTE